jgi:MFS family permease
MNPNLPTPRSAARRFALVSGLTWLPVGLHLPAMVLLMSFRGLDVATIGLVVTVHSVLVVALELPTGALSDALGRRGVQAAAAVFNLVAFGVLAVAHNPWLFALSAGLKGVGRALSSGPAQAWYVDTVHATDPDGDLRTGLSWGASAASAALAVGVLGGGFLPLGLGAAGLREDLALAAPAALAAVASAVLLAVVLAAMPEPVDRQRLSLRTVLAATPQTALRGIRLAIGNPVLGLIFAVTATLGIMLNAIELLTPGRLAELIGGASAGAAGYAVVASIGFAASAAGSALAPLVGRFTGSAPRIGVVGVLISSTGVFALAASLNLDGTAAVIASGGSYALIFVGLGVLGPASSELLNGQARASERATVISLDSLMLQASGAISSVTLMRLAASTGRGPVWCLAGGVLVLSTLALVAIHRRLRVPAPSDPMPEPAVPVR